MVRYRFKSLLGYYNIDANRSIEEFYSIANIRESYSKDVREVFLKELLICAKRRSDNSISLRCVHDQTGSNNYTPKWAIFSQCLSEPNHDVAFIIYFSNN